MGEMALQEYTLLFEGAFSRAIHTLANKLWVAAPQEYAIQAYISPPILEGSEI